MFRVRIDSLTRNLDETQNEWHFRDPVFPATYVLKIKRDCQLSSEDWLWRMRLEAKHTDPSIPSPNIDVSRVQLVTSCDQGLPNSLSMKVNGSFPRTVFEIQGEKEIVHMFAAACSSYVVFEITRVHTVVASIQ